MFTKLTFKSLGFYLKVGRIIQSLPFKYKVEFCDGGGILYLVHGKKSYLLWILNILLIYAYTINLYLSFFNGCFFSDILDPARIAMDFLFSFFFTIVLLQQLTLILKMGQLVVFFNTTFQFHRTYFEKIFGKSKVGVGKYDDFSQFVITMFVCMWLYYPLPFIGLFFLNPDHPRYLFHRIFYLPGHKNYWTYSFWFIVEYYIYISSISNFCFFFFLIVISTNCLNFWLKFSRPPSKDSEELADIADAQGKRKEALQIFKCLQILNTLSNNCLSELSVPAFILMFLGAESFGVYGCVKLHGAFDMPLFMMFPICFFASFLACAIVFTVVGNTFAYSEKFIKMWEAESAKKSETTEIKPLIPFGVKVLNFFIIKRMGFLFSILIISNLTTNAILLH